MFTRLPLFQIYYKLIAIDFSKKQNIENGPKAIQQINFTRNLTRGGGTRMYFIIEEAKKNSFRFFKKEQLNYYDFISFE